MSRMTIKDWLYNSEERLSSVGIVSARLDSELILCDVVSKDRTWLISHADKTIPSAYDKELEESIARRLKREPLAYIRGYKEFYGRNFAVTRDTLIPRPETEVMVELLAPLVATGKKLIDVGSGSGAIAISAKLEYPDLVVEASDVSLAALEIVRRNAETLGADITVYQSDLLKDAVGTCDIICANLPYVDAAWQVSEETRYEPDMALYAKDDGLALIKTLIEQSAGTLEKQGYLLLEADPRQHGDIIAYGHSHDHDWHQTDGFIVVLQRR